MEIISYATSKIALKLRKTRFNVFGLKTDSTNLIFAFRITFITM